MPGPSQAITVCGTWQAAADRTVHAQCVFHVQYVEALQQSRDNIRSVGTPYSTAIADFYSRLLTPISPTSAPAPQRSVRYSYSNISLTLSPGVTLAVPTFELVLEQDQSSTRSHGALMGNTLTLNEMPPVSTRTQADIERTLYHEAIHFIAGEIAQLNRTRRQAAAQGGAAAQIVHPEFDPQTFTPYRAALEAALTPVFQRALQQYTTGLTPQRIAALSASYAGLKWITWVDEMIARIEEAVYLARRAGRGFGQADLNNLTPAWLYTAAYWSNLHVNHQDMHTHLASERQYLDQNVVPVVRQIQTEFLRRRP